MENSKKFKVLVNYLLDLWGEADILDDVTMYYIYNTKMYLDSKISKEEYKKILNLFLINSNYMSIVEKMVIVSYNCKKEDNLKNVRDILLVKVNDLKNSEIINISEKELRKNKTLVELENMFRLYREFLIAVLFFIYKEILFNLNKFNIEEDNFNDLQLAVLFHKN